MGIDPQGESSSVLIVRLWRLICAVDKRSPEMWLGSYSRVVLLMKERRCDREERKKNGCRCIPQRWPC